ncbi:MAG: hypothetical protein LBQ90_11820 [Synergistaceae bacterium]|jgi:hypothetical protein|nr:hypothetical protein [Synergistaceae bacterium]
MTGCIWYVSGFQRPWEAAVIGNLAAAMNASGFPPQVYVEGGTGNLRMNGVLSWDSLTLFDRLSIIFFRGNLWHLWGKAPFWWGLVRLRARTVHTALDASPDWKGHPTRLFAEQVLEGESLVKPTFEIRVAWAKDSTEDADASSVLLLAASPTDALKKAVERSGMETISLAEGETASIADLGNGRAALVDDTPSNALLAAWATMQGLPVVARPSPLIRSLLGRDGCFTVKEDTEDAWFSALEAARSEEGRTVSAGARRFLKENFSAAEGAESLAVLYRSIGLKAGGKRESGGGDGA